MGKLVRKVLETTKEDYKVKCYVVPRLVKYGNATTLVKGNGNGSFEKGGGRMGLQQ